MKKRDFEIISLAYKEWKKSETETIFQAYKTTPSDAKINAYYSIYGGMRYVHGRRFRIVHACVQTFTCGYIYESDREERFVYFLPTCSLEIPIKELQ